MHADALFRGSFEQIEVLRDAERGVLAFVALHDTRLGPAFGGIRRWRYPQPSDGLADALRLAEAMTWKCALAGVPGGGGKTVICELEDRPVDREAAYDLVGRHVAELGGRHYTGPDVGTEPADLAVVARRAPGFVAHGGNDGPGELGDATARGVFAGLRAVAERIERPLDGLHVTLQGLGAVGWRLGGLLVAAGARLTVADVRGEATARAAREWGAAVVASDAIAGVEADVFAPCALGGVLAADSARTLRARAVAGAANNVLADPAVGAELFARGIVVAPDFVINAGGLVQGALFHLDGRLPPPERVEAIGTRVGEIVDAARASGSPPEVVALQRAREIVAAAPASRYFPSPR